MTQLSFFFFMLLLWQLLLVDWQLFKERFWEMSTLAYKISLVSRGVVKAVDVDGDFGNVIRVACVVNHSADIA